MTIKNFFRTLAGYIIYRLISRKPTGKAVYLYDERGKFIKIIR